MTETTTKPARDWPGADHERPCFCEHCLGATLWDLLEQQAALLDGVLTDGLYEPGSERDLAAEAVHAIPPGRRNAALDQLAYDHLEPRIMAVDCLLNECDERSYAVARQLAGILTAAIREQGNAPGALRT